MKKLGHVASVRVSLLNRVVHLKRETQPLGDAQSAYSSHSCLANPMLQTHSHKQASEKARKQASRRAGQRERERDTYYDASHVENPAAIYRAYFFLCPFYVHDVHFLASASALQSSLSRT